MYDQLVQAQRKSAEKLSAAKLAAQRSASDLERAQRDLASSERALAALAADLRGAARAARALAASARFGAVGATDDDNLLAPLAAEADALSRRLNSLASGAQARRADVSAGVARAVPLEWVGIASEVRVMGSWDGWARPGVALNPSDEDDDDGGSGAAGGGGSTFCRFVGELRLRPGTYHVKLLVDGEWRLCGGWPEVDDGAGNTVNVLTVVAVGGEEDEEGGGDDDD
jgi:hypothetical protein